MLAALFRFSFFLLRNFACRILASSRYPEFFLQYNSVLKRLDLPPLLKFFFFKNPAKKGILQLQIVFDNLLEYGRHVARLHRCRRRRRAYAPTSNTASHDNHEQINSWVSFSFPWCLWGSAWRPFRPPGALLQEVNNNDLRAWWQTIGQNNVYTRYTCIIITPRLFHKVQLLLFKETFTTKGNSIHLKQTLQLNVNFIITL